MWSASKSCPGIATSVVERWKTRLLTSLMFSVPSVTSSVRLAWRLPVTLRSELYPRPRRPPGQDTPRTLR